MASLALRAVPDRVQLQVLLGTLLGRGRLVREAEGSALELRLSSRHGWLAQWTYERLAPFVPAPRGEDGRIELRSAPHPFFDDVGAVLSDPEAVRRLAGPAALWVWSLHARVDACERSDAPRCSCVPVRPPARRAVISSGS